MGFLNFIVSGPRGSFTNFRRDNYEEDTPPKILNNLVNPFEGKITSSHDDGLRKTVVIDQVVQIQAVSDSLFKSSKATWETLRLKTKISFIASFIGGAAAIAASIALGILVPPFLLVALSIALVSCAIIGFGGFVVHRYRQASEQYDAWIDPVEKAVNSRKQALSQGFAYAQAQDLKEKIITQEETTLLWQKLIASWKEKLQQAESAHPQTQGNIVKEFFENCPIDSTVLNYAFKEIPTRYDLYKREYYKLHHQYCDISINSSQRAINTYQNSTNSLYQLSEDYENRTAAIYGISNALHTVPAPRRVHNTIAVGAAAAQVGNSIAQLGMIAENFSATTQRVDQIKQEKYLQYSALFKPVKELLETS